MRLRGGQVGAHVSAVRTGRKQRGTRTGGLCLTAAEGPDAWLCAQRGDQQPHARTWTAATRTGGLRAVPERTSCPAGSPGQQTARLGVALTRRRRRRVESHAPGRPGRRPGRTSAAPPCGRGLSRPLAPLRHTAGPPPRPREACASSPPASSALTGCSPAGWAAQKPSSQSLCPSPGAGRTFCLDKEHLATSALWHDRLSRRLHHGGDRKGHDGALSRRAELLADATLATPRPLGERSAAGRLGF